MAMKKLAPDIQLIFCASTQITTYKNAVEELVYNSLDAEATSIAIRVNMEENSIQVIDNGIGVAKNDFKMLGQRYATSKCVDISTLKSAPNKYGFRGQSLADIIEVTKRLTISSRCAGTEETWTKEFYKGKECRLAEAIVRPSKGTTVEIKGFLHNLHIQKRSVDSLAELNDIKTFLQQLSLVLNNISLSLRDDSKNEIVFKLHKNRDIYQTLSTVFEVEKKDVQELKVQKNEYKVTGIIANRDSGISQYHWVYLNGKFVNNSKIYKVIDEYLIKLLGLKNTIQKTKSKNEFVKLEDVTSKKTIPMYFIFITCPYYEYDIICKSTLEFKDWERLKKLIEKLVKFYVGDVRLKEIATKAIENKADKKEDETREKVKKIMKRILRSNSRKPRVSQLKNGVKGKIIKRKFKKKTAKLPVTQIIRPDQMQENTVVDNNINPTHVSTEAVKNYHVKNTSDKKEDTFYKNNNTSIKKDMKHNINVEIIQPIKNKKEKTVLRNICKENRRGKSNVQKLKEKSRYLAKKKQDKLKVKMKQKLTNAKKKLQVCKEVLKDDKSKPFDDPFLNKFKHPSDSIKHRCNILAINVDNLLSYQKKRKRKIFVNETVHYSTVVKNNKNVSVRRKVDEIVIQDFIPLPPRFDLCRIDNRVWKKLPENSCKTSYDLVQTILKSQHEYTTSNKNQTNAEPSKISNCKHIETCGNQNNETKYVKKSDVQNSNCYYETLSEVYKFTYDSHHNNRSSKSHQYKNYTRPGYEKFNTNDHFEFTETRNGNKHFITKQSRENFVEPNLQQFRNTGLTKHFLSKRQPHKWKHSFFTNYADNNDTWTQDNSFTIDFTRSNNCENNLCDLGKQNTHIYSQSQQHQEYGILQPNTACGGTYTIISNTSQTSLGDGDYQYRQSNHISLTQRTYFMRTSNERRINSKEGHVDFVYHDEENEELVVSKSQNQFNSFDVEPINICETTMKSNQNVLEDKNFSKRILNDSLFNSDFSIDSVLFDRDAYTHAENNFKEKQANKDIIRHSQYFADKKSDLNETKNYLLEIDQVVDKTNDKDKIKRNKQFDLKMRPRFVPKGLSPIFMNCQTTKACDYNLEKDYYEHSIYNQFANKVQVQSEFFEPNIQHMKELKTKDIARINERVDKDNASLVFNAESLDKAIVLRQIDSKFIAMKIKGKCYQTAEESEYLVLFDQHAVHERIRLEQNLADYLINEEWQSVVLDEIPLKLTKEEVIYMHNFKAKFSQFGLRWIVLSKDEVKITGIPEAVLGKNPRQVDVVMKAVRNLISEEMEAMKTQKGCISLYPKSLMDLVFSEACRYAIKFGDKLSMHECVKLLKSLSKCKTPFQCAHGRPVMAVLMRIESDPNKRQYKIVTSKLNHYIASLKLK